MTSKELQAWCDRFGARFTVGERGMGTVDIIFPGPIGASVVNQIARDIYFQFPITTDVAVRIEGPDRDQLAAQVAKLGRERDEAIRSRDESDASADQRLQQLAELRDLCPQKLATRYPFDVIKHRLQRFNQEELGRNREAARLRNQVAELTKERDALTGQLQELRADIERRAVARSASWVEWAARSNGALIMRILHESKAERDALAEEVRAYRERKQAEEKGSNHIWAADRHVQDWESKHGKLADLLANGERTPAPVSYRLCLTSEELQGMVGAKTRVCEEEVQVLLHELERGAVVTLQLVAQPRPLQQRLEHAQVYRNGGTVTQTSASGERPGRADVVSISEAFSKLEVSAPPQVARKPDEVQSAALFLTTPGCDCVHVAPACWDPSCYLGRHQQKGEAPTPAAPSVAGLQAAVDLLNALTAAWPPVAPCKHGIALAEDGRLMIQLGLQRLYRFALDADELSKPTAEIVALIEPLMKAALELGQAAGEPRDGLVDDK